jgi:hypothetical protein
VAEKVRPLISIEKIAVPAPAAIHDLAWEMNDLTASF